MPARRILYLARWFPDPPDNGARLRAWAQLQALTEHHDVTLLGFLEPGQEETQESPLRQICSRVVTVRRRPFRPEGWRARLAFLSPTPRSLVDTFSAAMRDAVEHEVRSATPDVVIVATLDMSVYLPWLRTVPAVADELEIGVFADRLRSASRRSRARAALTWAKLGHYLRRTVPRYRLCLTSSTLEQRLLQRMLPGYRHFHVLENAVDTRLCAEVRGERRASRLVFAGSLTYDANLDAMNWFCNRILPRVRSARPDVELLITGAPSAEFRPPEGVQLTGYVDDVRSLVASAAISVTPIRRGSGTRLKILESMALETPVVSTSKGAEGLAVVHGEHLLIADDESIFAAQIIRLLSDAALRQRLAAAGRRLVVSRYDIEAIGRRLNHLIESTLSSDTAGF